MAFIRDKILKTVLKVDFCLGIGLNQFFPDITTVTFTLTELAHTEAKKIRPVFHNPTPNEWKNCRAFPMKRQKGSRKRKKTR